MCSKVLCNQPSAFERSYECLTFRKGWRIFTLFFVLNIIESIDKSPVFNERLFCSVFVDFYQILKRNEMFKSIKRCSYLDAKANNWNTVTARMVEIL